MLIACLLRENRKAPLLFYGENENRAFAQIEFLPLPVLPFCPPHFSVGLKVSSGNRRINTETKPPLASTDLTQTPNPLNGSLIGKSCLVSVLLPLGPPRATGGGRKVRGRTDGGRKEVERGNNVAKEERRRKKKEEEEERSWNGKIRRRRRRKRRRRRRTCFSSPGVARYSAFDCQSRAPPILPFVCVFFTGRRKSPPNPKRRVGGNGENRVF